jgi:hypothetical protein
MRFNFEGLRFLVEVTVLRAGPVRRRPHFANAIVLGREVWRAGLEPDAQFGRLTRHSLGRTVRSFANCGAAVGLEGAGEAEWRRTR